MINEINTPPHVGIMTLRLNGKKVMDRSYTGKKERLHKKADWEQLYEYHEEFTIEYTPRYATEDKKYTFSHSI